MLIKLTNDEKQRFAYLVLETVEDDGGALAGRRYLLFALSLPCLFLSLSISVLLFFLVLLCPCAFVFLSSSLSLRFVVFPVLLPLMVWSVCLETNN